jgi:hypothetical protein
MSVSVNVAVVTRDQWNRALIRRCFRCAARVRASMRTSAHPHCVTNSMADEQKHGQTQREERTPSSSVGAPFNTNKKG